MSDPLVSVVVATDRPARLARAGAWSVACLVHDLLETCAIACYRTPDL